MSVPSSAVPSAPVLPYIDFAGRFPTIGTPAWFHDMSSGSGLEWRFCDDRHFFGVGEQRGQAGIEALAEYPYHEFTVVQSGELRLASGEGAVIVKTGEAVVIPRGLPIGWSQASESRRIRIVYRGLAPAAPPAGIVRIDPFGALGPGQAPAADTVLTSPPPTAQTRVDFIDPTRRFLAGVWHCDAYRRKPMPANQHELALILAGTPDIDAADGRRLRSFRPGESFFTWEGADYALGSAVPFRKLFCILKTAA